MIDWGSLQVARLWPLALLAIVAAALCFFWFARRRKLFPDLQLLDRDPGDGGRSDWLPLATGILLLLLFTAAMPEPTVTRVVEVEQRARDFLLLVDTSRSMRHDTAVRRDAFELNYKRRAGAFSEAVDNPDTLPYVARFELARESLLTFLSARLAEDRVGLVYFNDDTHPVAALTSDIAFVIDQLATMDDYVNWGTDIATAVDGSIAMLQRYSDRNRRALILLTDAETRYTDELQQQLARLASEDLSFYLLWITADNGGKGPDEEAQAFLDLARSVGVVVTIDNLDSDSLRDSFQDISRLEGYTYVDEKRSIVRFSQPLLDGARLLLVAWLFLAAAVFFPGSSIDEFKEINK